MTPPLSQATSTLEGCFGALNERQRRLVEDAARAGWAWSLTPGDPSVAVVKRAGDTSPSRMVISRSGARGTGMHVALVDSGTAGAQTISHAHARLLLLSEVT